MKARESRKALGLALAVLFLGSGLAGIQPDAASAVQSTETAAIDSPGEQALAAGVPLKASLLPNWTKLWDRSSGGVNSDGIFSIPLTSNDAIGSATAGSKTVFFHSDSLIGNVNPTTLAMSGTWVNSYVDVLNGNQPDPAKFSQVWGARGNMSAGTGGIWGAHRWIGDGVTVGNNVYFTRYTSCCAWQTTSVELVKVPIVNGSMDYANYSVLQSNTQLFNQRDGYATTWGSGIMANTVEAGAPNPDGYIYFYGYRLPLDHSWKNEPVVARVLPADIEDTTRYTFWTGTSWSSTSSDANTHAAAIGPFHPWSEMSVTPINSGVYAGKYMFVYARGGLTTTMEYAIGDTPWGPFSPGVAFYDAQEPWTYATTSTVTYNAKAHPSLSPPGHLYVTYNVNPIYAGTGTNEIYRPRWIDIDLNTLKSKPILANKSSQQPAAASGWVAGYGPEKATSSVFAKWAETGSGTHWMTIDLGANHYVSKYGLKNAGWRETPSWNTRDWRIDVSQDGTNWTTVDSVSGNAASVVMRTFPETQARYVRLYITAGTQLGGDGAARIYGFDVYGAAQPVVDHRPNLALGRPVTASGQNTPACSGSRLVDGRWSDPATDKWCDATVGDKWATVDLQGIHSIDRWVVRNASVAGEFTRLNTNYYRLQTSLDGQAWTTADTVDYNLLPTTDRSIAPVTARFVRLYITKPALNNDAMARVQEFEVYGGQTSLFMRGGSDGSLYRKTFDGSSWTTNWTNLGGPNGGTFKGAPAVVASGDRVTVFVRGTNDAAWTNTYAASTGQWTGWTSLGGVLLDSPAASVAADTGVISLVVRGGSDGSLYGKTFDGSSWTTNWTSLGGPNGGTVKGAPSVVSSGGQVKVFVRGTDDAVWTNTYLTGTGPLTGWTGLGWSSLGGVLLDSPAASLDDSTGVISVFIRSSSGSLHRKTFDGLSWTSAWTNLGGPNGATFKGAPAAVSSDGQVKVFLRGTDDAAWTNTYTSGTGQWTGWSSLGGVLLDSPAATTS